MKSLTNWSESNKAKGQTFNNSINREYNVFFDSYKETEKAWIIFKNGNKYILAKSVTKMSLDYRMISVPSWLYMKVFTENENLAF